MAITAVTPASSSTIVPGDAIAFTVNDTYTSMVIRVQTSTALAAAYDTALGGAQAGYTVSVVDNGDGTHTFTVSRDAGWDADPQLIYVTEDETGSPATTNLSYNLAGGEAAFPQGSVPYNQLSDGIDHGGLSGLGDDDHTQYLLASGTRGLVGNLAVANLITIDGRDLSVDGAKLDGIEALADVTDAANVASAGALMTDGTTTQASAVYFNERPARVNTPTAGKAELWVKNTTPNTIYFTDDAGTDHDLTYIGSGDVSGPAGNSFTHEVALFSGTTGKILESLGHIYIVQSGDRCEVEFTNNGGPYYPLLSMTERSAVPTFSATKGKYFALNDTPNSPVFTTDDSRAGGVHKYLDRHFVTLTAGIKTSGTAGQWYSWTTQGPYQDITWDTANGGTGASPTTTAVWAYPGIYIPRDTLLVGAEYTIVNPDTGSVTHAILLSLTGEQSSNGQTATGATTEFATAPIITAVATPTKLLNNMTIGTDFIPADTTLFFFVKETSGNASRVDMRLSLTLTLCPLAT